MSRTAIAVLAVVLLLTAGGILWLAWEPAPPPTATDAGEIPGAAATDARLRVASPRPNAVVSDPLTVGGEARGPWYFEGSFPVRLLDGEGRELGAASARAEGEWTTGDFVPFGATLNFRAASTGTGLLVLERSNPSGLAENAATVVVPVRLDEAAPRSRAVRVFFNSSRLGGDSCEAVWPVPRAVDATGSGVRAALTALLAGPTAAERDRGFLTNIPEGVTVRSLRLEEGTAHVDFDRSLDRAAGSCRVLAIRAQVERTLLQFPTVDDVVISVGGETEAALQP